jgi:hypothetical protein
MISMQCNVEIGTISANAMGPRRTTEKFDRVGRSQGLTSSQLSGIEYASPNTSFFL